MKVKLDENMPGDASALLTSMGCDVHTVFLEKLSGHPDPEVVAAATAEGRSLVTFDKGIANPTDPAYAKHSGIILLRLSHPSSHATLTLLKTHFPALIGKDLAERIVVLSPGGIRIR
jgi:predicted nuclease of predicted toxin-antitoxin system